MSIATEITRIQTDRNTIRNKLVTLGLATSSDTLDTLAAAIEGIVNNGSISANVKEGETYTIPKGFHDGTGTVSGVAGGGNYDLESKTVTPTKTKQTITPDAGYYGLSDVAVEPIPDAYQDVTSVTATAGDVLTGKIYVAADGTVTTGTMANNGAITKALDTKVISYTIPAGFHNGEGVVTITLETKDVTPTKSSQTITPSEGKVLSEVVVAPIPDEYITTTDATATADKILIGETAYVAGVKVEGTMPDNSEVSYPTLDTATTEYAVPAGYHAGTGSVKIQLETKTVTPTKQAQSITPSAKKVLSKVDVAAIPDAYQDVTAVDAVATDVLSGKKIVAADGTVVTGSMANNGDVSGTIEGLTVTSYTIPAGYTTGGTVSLTNDIETALAAI